MYKSNWNNLIQGVEMGRFKGGNGMQRVEMGRFRGGNGIQGWRWVG